MRAMTHQLDPITALDWLAGRIGAPWPGAACATLTGLLGERRLRARRFPDCLTIALCLDRPLTAAPQACLVLAATPEACDDGLYLADHRLWLLRRYPVPLLPCELDLLLKQQQALAALLAAPPRGDAAPLPIAGRYA